MKKLIILSVSLCITCILNAQVSKTVSSGSVKAGSTVTVPVAAPNINTSVKTEEREYETSPNQMKVLAELERAVHGNLQMLDGYLNRPTTSQELMSLTGNDRIKARQLVIELEQNLRAATVPNPNAPTQALSATDSNGRNIIQLEKVQQLNRLLDSNNQVSVKNGNAIPDANRPGMDYSRSEQRVELTRMETEKQIRNEMENYRNELLDRLIKEEYYRLINDKTSEAPDTNLGRTSRLAKYKALREMLQEQMGRRNKPGIPNSGQPNIPIQNQVGPDNLMQQLDSKIREEEQRAEMKNRRRMDMEMRMQQEHQKQLPVENKR